MNIHKERTIVPHPAAAEKGHAVGESVVRPEEGQEAFRTGARVRYLALDICRRHRSRIAGRVEKITLETAAGTKRLAVRRSGPDKIWLDIRSASR